jgi:phosphatidylserine/phosphatidylglycerophosphate/cardiolipin synthase-like enzyme
MNAEVDIKLGHKIGDFFLPQLQNAKYRLWIMSPWLSTEYMELAVNKKKAGLDVRVTTSNDFFKNSQKESISKLIESQIRVIREENKKLKYIGICLVVIGIILTINTNWISLLLSLIGAILFFRGLKKTETYWISKLGDGNLTVLQYNPYKMVHAKIYIVDDTVIIGSANLTGNGLNNNTEVMAAIKNNEIAQNLIDVMNNIQEISGLQSISYDTLGKEIEYVEPKKSHYRRWRVQ